jgi:hypothetical protein
MYSVADSISVVGICSGWIRRVEVEPPDTGVDVWPGVLIWMLSLLVLRACVVPASHLRFAPSRSIPWPGVRT